MTLLEKISLIQRQEREIFQNEDLKFELKITNKLYSFGFSGGRDPFYIDFETVSEQELQEYLDLEIESNRNVLGDTLV